MDEQKSYVRFFEICKYTFLIFENGDKQKKTVPGILRFLSIIFVIFENGMSKKIVPGILRFVSMLF